MLGEDTLDNIAHCFAKHSTETCKKFYVQFFSNREAARLPWKSLQMFKPIGKEEERAISMRQSKLAKSSIPTSEKIKSWYQQLQNILKLSEKLDLNDNGLDALIAQFSKDMQLNEDLESSNEQEVQEEEEDIDIDNEEVQVQAEEEDVDDKDEEVQDEEEEFPEDTPQTKSSVTTCNVTNLEPRVDLARLPDLGIISPPQSSDEQEEEEEQDSSDDDDSIKLTVSKEEAIKFVKNNFGVIPYK